MKQFHVYQSKNGKYYAVETTNYTMSEAEAKLPPEVCWFCVEANSPEQAIKRMARIKVTALTHDVYQLLQKVVSLKKELKQQQGIMKQEIAQMSNSLSLLEKTYRQISDRGSSHKTK